jgi:hypothetical protein
MFGADEIVAKAHGFLPGQLDSLLCSGCEIVQTAGEASSPVRQPKLVPEYFEEIRHNHLIV